jgi:hypothetical protein
MADPIVKTDIVKNPADGGFTNIDPNNPHHYLPQEEGESWLHYMLRMGLTPAQASAQLYASSYDSYQPDYDPNMSFDERLNRAVNPRLYMTPEQQQQYDAQKIYDANSWAQHYQNKGVDADLANQHGMNLVNTASYNANNPYSVATGSDPYNTTGTPESWVNMYNAFRTLTSANSTPTTTNTGNTGSAGNTGTTTPATVDVGPQNTGIDPNTGLAIHTGSQQTNTNTGINTNTGNTTNQGTPSGSYQNPASYVPGLNRGSWRGATWRPVAHQTGG